jgi:hypothetical protein
MRSEEVRTVAEGSKDPMVQAVMLRIADDFDRLAKHAQESADLEARLQATIKRWRGTVGQNA